MNLTREQWLALRSDGTIVRYEASSVIRVGPPDEASSKALKAIHAVDWSTLPTDVLVKVAELVRNP